VTYYICYQVDGTDIKERAGRKSCGFTRETAKDLLGHVGINVTLCYPRLILEHKAHAVAKLEALQSDCGVKAKLKTRSFRPN
jgi:hypothetical protein